MWLDRVGIFRQGSSDSVKSFVCFADVVMVVEGHALHSAQLAAVQILQHTLSGDWKRLTLCDARMALTGCPSFGGGWRVRPCYDTVPDVLAAVPQ